MRLVPVAVVLFSAIACDRRPDDLPPLPEEFPLFPTNACAASRPARVACTLDGDTFDVGACGDGLGERVRMLGINAPEIAHEEPAQCYGDLAATALRELIDGRDVELGFDYECFDRYGRSLAYVWLPQDGAAPVEEEDTGGAGSYLLVNEWMLANGFARLAPEDWTAQDIRLLPVMVAAETRAREQGLGLWSACE